MAARFPGDVSMILWLALIFAIIALAAVPGWLVVKLAQWAGWG